MSYLTLPDVTPTSITMLNPEPAVSEVNLGGAYRQRISLGLGHLPVRWHVSWSHLITKDKQILADFLTHSQGVDLFHFAPETKTESYLVYCDNWQVKSLPAGYWHVVAQFQQA